MKREPIDNHPANPPIDAVPGDHTAHQTVQRSNEHRARAEAGLGADGNLKPDFDGTMPKITDNEGTLEAVTMQELKERAAEQDGQTVEEQEEAAGLNIADDDNGRNTVSDEAEDDGAEVNVEELAAMTIDQIKEQIEELDAKQLKQLEKAEEKGKKRVGVFEAIERRRSAL